MNLSGCILFLLHGKAYVLRSAAKYNTIIPGVIWYHVILYSYHLHIVIIRHFITPRTYFLGLRGY